MRGLERRTLRNVVLHLALAGAWLTLDVLHGLSDGRAGGDAFVQILYPFSTGVWAFVAGIHLQRWSTLRRARLLATASAASGLTDRPSPDGR